ncbi:MAG: ATP-binding cassette domain-containing protein [Calditrichaeota bacterium]|nr:MAG: ATP-binding cassette domain-containing protein [Calditrichota bacterium]
MILFDNVSVVYPLPGARDFFALKNIQLTIETGEFVAIMGLNGSGKTTLARLCNGLVMPSAGRVVVDGHTISPQDASAVPEIRRRVGMVFQNPENQIVSTTVEREIAFGLENLGIDHEEMHRRVEKALKNFELLAYRDRPPHRLSGGEKQRLALAAIMAMQPAHLILDEPTSLLDFKNQRQLMETILALHRNPQTPPHTVIHITQFPAEALYAGRLIVLHQGQVALDGPPMEIFLQEKRLQQLGLRPPVEFSAYLRLLQKKYPLKSIQDLLLRPIL